MARARDTGMRPGTGPIRLEPVAADVRIDGRRVAAVRLLGHDGRRTDRAPEVRDGAFTPDGARDRTPHDEVVFE